MDARAIVTWSLLVATLCVPLIAAALSPLHAWRDPIYIAAGFAGIVGLCLMVIQPALAAGYLPGVRIPRGRALHRWCGAALVLCVVLHVAGLWITSPPDVIDALLFRSPTPFSAWGVVAMWALFLTALVAALRRRFAPKLWRLMHKPLALVIVGGTIIHALQIEGTMEPVTKLALCAIAGLVTSAALLNVRKSAGRS